jgi:DNA/RNA endonuclease YhcR with UshA esterase domain
MKEKLLLVGMLAAPLSAHHAFSAEFDANRPVKLKGTVTQWELVNPHSWLHIDVKNEDGTVTNWMIEGGSPNALLRAGLTKHALPKGTEIVVDGYQSKDRGNLAVGKNITFADGKRMLLGSSAPDGGKK